MTTRPDNNGLPIQKGKRQAEEQWRRSAERLRQWHPVKGQFIQDAARQRRETAQECVPLTGLV